MVASGTLALERLLAGNGSHEKPASLALLSGPGAKLHLASELPSRETRAAPLPVGLAPFERLLWARPRRVKEALAAAEMLLSTGFPLVVVDLGLPPLRGAAPEAAWVRLARAAEIEGAALLLAAPYRVSGFAAGAVVRMDEARFVWVGGGASPRLLIGTGSRLSLEREVQRSARSAEILSLSLLPFPAAHP